MKVTWDEAKNRRNRKNHGISFEEAQVIFDGDPDLVLYIPDADHSDDEERWTATGPIAVGLVLVVFTEWDGDAIRLISARFANKREAALYHTRIEGRMP